MTECRPVLHQLIQCRPPPFCRSCDTYFVLMASKRSKSVNKENLELKRCLVGTENIVVGPVSQVRVMEAVNE